MTPDSGLTGVLPHERTPAEPGPGPLSGASLRALELAIGRRVDGLLAGDYRSAFPGIGSELHQVRQYEPGDDVRRIEWNVTARTGRPHVRVELAERVLVTWLVIDASASMTLRSRSATPRRGAAIGSASSPSARQSRACAVRVRGAPRCSTRSRRSGSTPAGTRR
jgi:uncharacterized protein (DUF58 family)